MDLQWTDEAFEARFEAYVDSLARCLGHKDREEPFRHYCAGLLLSGERKSVEPMAAQLSPEAVSAEHQSLLHFVGQSPWSWEALLAAVRDAVLPALTARGPVEAWIVDDTSFPKKGRHSVGVARQYSGALGKQDNCQVAVSLSLATAEASLPVAWQLYLPEDWAADEARRRKTRVPEEVHFQAKWEIALAQLAAMAADPTVPNAVVLSDAEYGNNMKVRNGVAELGLQFVLGVLPSTSVWPPGMEPLPPRPDPRGPGRPSQRLRRTPDHKPCSLKALAQSHGPQAFRTVAWREGATGKPLSSRFAVFRVRPAHKDWQRSTPWPEQSLLIEWPEGEAEPTKYWLSNLPAETSLKRLVYLAKLRWLIERDYLELKQELGLGHYEGRSWPGFHHHAALAIAAYGFLLTERLAIPPSAPYQRPVLQGPALSRGYGPRGTPDPHPATSTRINSNAAHQNCRCTGSAASTMSLLSTEDCRVHRNKGRFMTQ